MAYQRYQDTICGECGGYVEECRNPENKGVYEVLTDSYCYRKEALEDVTRAEKFKPENGQLLSVREIDESIVSRGGPVLHCGKEAPPEPNDHEA